MTHQHKHGHASFADIARAAARMNSPERDAWQRPEEIVAALGLRPGDTVADVGAGTGYMTAHLSRAVGRTGAVLALDAEPAMSAYLTSRIGELGPARVTPQHTRSDDPELAPASIDAALILDAWHHMSDRVAYARKLRAALKPGGRLVVVDATLEGEEGPPREMRVAADDVVQELIEAGFRASVAPASLPRHYVVWADSE
jgi:ubiquinone/menaquinone biosynthesis C-methylase UbiE